MTRMMGIFAAAILMTAFTVHAQENPSAYIESDGEATITVSPNFASFWFHFGVREGSMEDAMAVAEGFDNRVNVALQEANLAPVDFEVTPVAIN